MKLISLDPGYITKEDTLAVKKIRGIDDVIYYDHLPSDQRELYLRLKHADLVTSRLYLKYDKNLFDHAPELKAIFNNSVGFDNIDIREATRRGIKVYNCPGYNAQSVAEFAFSLIVSLVRKIPVAQDHVRAGGVEYRPFEGSELHEKVLGVIGSGNVGKKIVEIGQGFGMKIMVNTKHPSNEKAASLKLKRFYEIREVLANADVLVVAIPLNKGTLGLVGKNELALMKSTAILVNVARQTIVNEYELAKRLLSGRLGGAALDMVIEDPFQIKKFPLEIQEMVNLPNVIVTPHIGGETREANQRLGQYFYENVQHFLEGKNINCVNFN